MPPRWIKFFDPSPPLGPPPMPRGWGSRTELQSPAYADLFSFTRGNWVALHLGGEIWLYHSQQMKDSTIFQQMYL